MQTSKHELLPPKDIKFGEDIKPYFMLDEKYLMVNSGSYGIIPKYVYEAKKQYAQQIEKNPNYHYKYVHPKLIKDRKQLVANFIHCDPSNLGFILNATEGLNTCLRGMKYEKGDIILTTDCCFGAVKEIVPILADMYGVEYVQIPTQKAMLNDNSSLIENITQTIQKYKGKIKIAIFDHISSTPSCLFQIKKIIQLFKDNDIPLLVDGAHTFGRLKLDINELNPDFYVTNLHKWGYLPKSLAVIYVNPKYHHLIQPTGFCSNSTNDISLGDKFSFHDMRDYTNVYCIKEALEFWNQLGPERVRNYCNELATQGSKIMLSKFKTELLVDDMNYCSAMFTILVPDHIKNKIKDIHQFSVKIHEAHNFFPFIHVYENKMYIRVTAQIVNSEKDYESYADKVLAFGENLQEGI